MKKIGLIGLLALWVTSVSSPLFAQKIEQALYVSKPGERIYRIPAVACTVDGTLIAVSDNR